MKRSITQSYLWRNLQRDLGETCFYEHYSDLHYLAILKHTPVGNYLYLPYGPVYQNPTSFSRNLAMLEDLAHKYNAFFIRIEPQDPDFPSYAPLNAVKTADLNPKDTWLLDLTGNPDSKIDLTSSSDDEFNDFAAANSDAAPAPAPKKPKNQNPYRAPKFVNITDKIKLEEPLRDKLPSRLLRYYRGMARKGLFVETSRDPENLQYLINFQQALASEKGINTFSRKYLETELRQPFATLYLLKKMPDDQIAERNAEEDAYKAEAARTPKRRRPEEQGKANYAKNQSVSGDSDSSSQSVASATGMDSATKSASASGKSPIVFPVTDPDHKPEVLAAGLVFDDKDTRYNLQGAQSDLGRKYHATGLLTLQMILDSKLKRHQRIFDFWGIAPEGAGPDHPWAGFTAFKKTFGGTEVHYAGTWDIVLDNRKYHLYQALRRLNRSLRRKF